jgi:hypothetical protein
MRPKHVIMWIAGTLALLMGLALGYGRFILDWNGRPFCHKQIMFGFLNVMHTSGGDILNDPKPFPNVKGLSQESLATTRDFMGDEVAWTNDYNYVAGLRENDPADLVLMYFNRPTRWNWHGTRPPTIFREKAWIIIPVDFGSGLNFRPHTGQVGECSERVSLDDFRIRLRRTLDFVRTNQRPNWQAVIAEHERFLQSIEHDKP